jgi:tellurite resistance protein TerC
MDATSIGTPWLWIGFLGFVVVMLALDLGVFHRKDHVVGYREALGWSVTWIGLALLFNLGIWQLYGAERGLEFLTGYVIEKSLSVDNIFVFVVVFSALGIPALYQHRVLYYGILTALGLRAAMIFAGSALIARFLFVLYLFGAFLVITGIKLFRQRHHQDDPESGRLMRWAKRVVPSTPQFHGHDFFVRASGRWLATPLFMALLLVEVSDVVFAVDSIPAIFAVTTDPFIVFTSNIFAILGLRSLFFLLANLVDKFRYLKIGLSAVLVFVGVKMIVMDWIKVPPLLSLLVILGILGIAVGASLHAARGEGTAPEGSSGG